MKRYYLFLAAVLLLINGSVSASVIEMNWLTSNGMELDFNLGSESFEDQWAGQFSPVRLDYDSNDINNFVPDLTTISYCVDLEQYTSQGLKYVVELQSAVGKGDNYRNAAWLMNQYAATADSAAKKAGLQVAIWEVIYDPTDPTHSLTGGDFNVEGSSTAYTYAEDYLAALATATFTGLDHYMIAHSAEKQDQLIATPIPMAVWLFGSGLLGLLSFRKRPAEV